MLPLSGALSSSNLPKDINLIELGLDGFCSHSVEYKLVSDDEKYPGGHGV